MRKATSYKSKELLCELCVGIIMEHTVEQKKTLIKSTAACI